METDRFAQLQISLARGSRTQRLVVGVQEIDGSPLYDLSLKEKW
jgi:hypothetical protein